MIDSTSPTKPPLGGIGVKADGQSAVKAFDVELDMDDLWMRMKAADVSNRLLCKHFEVCSEAEYSPRRS
jgi:hypothetical protein